MVMSETEYMTSLFFCVFEPSLQKHGLRTSFFLSLSHLTQSDPQFQTGSEVAILSFCSNSPCGLCMISLSLPPQQLCSPPD